MVKKNKPTAPAALKQDHLVYLDALRESAETNMYGARPYLQEEYPDLSNEDAEAILRYWMESFEDRHAVLEPQSASPVAHRVR